MEVKKVSKKVKARAPFMRNTEGEAGQMPGLRRKLVILNKSKSGEPLVLRILGPDNRIEEKMVLEPGMKLLVDGELATAMTTPSRMAVKKFSQKCDYKKQATRPGVVLQHTTTPRAKGRQASMMQLLQSRPGDHSGESPAAECGRNSIENGTKRCVGGKGRKLLVRKEFKKDESEDRFDLVQAHHGKDLVDEICTIEVDAVLSEGSTQAHHHGKDLWEAMPPTQGDNGERIVEKVNVEDVAKKEATLKRFHDGQKESVEDVGKDTPKLSKIQESGAGSEQVGLREARGDSCVMPRP